MRDPFRLLFVGWWMAGQSWMVTGQYLKPSVSVSPELVTLGENVTVHCHNAEHPGAEFSLYKGNLSLTRLLSQKAKDYEAEFIISITSISDAGTYQCDYCFKSSSQDLCSYYSDKVRISIVDPSISKPSIKMKPRNQNALQSSITIECHCHGDGLYFFLQKANTRGILQVLSGGPTGTANFHLQGKIKDAGRYICQYQHATAPFVWSEPSDPVELIVKDPNLSKPSIKVRPEGQHDIGAKVTVECKGTENGLTFSLHKSKSLTALQTMKAAGNTAKFSLSPLRREDAGNYTCQYYDGRNLFVSSEPSDPVRVVVTVISLTEIVAWLGAAGFVLLALVLIVAEAAYSWRKGEL